MLTPVEVFQVGVSLDSNGHEVVLVPTPCANLLLTGSLDHGVVCGHNSSREVTQEDISVGS